MFTQEQERKAQAALERKKAEKKKQLMAMATRYVAKMRMAETKLPFRILYDLELNSSKSNEIMPNRYYPKPAVTLKTASLRPPIPDTEEQKNSEYWRRMEEWKAADREEYWKPEQWEHLFARFLLAYDLDKFRNIDWTGEKIPENTEQRAKTYFKQVQQDAKKHPEKYFLEPNPRRQEHIRLYAVGVGYL